MSLESYSDSEIDSILSLVHEAGFKFLTIGQPCINRQGQLLTILGLATLENDNYQEDYNIKINEELENVDDKNSERLAICMYYDANNPMQ